MSRAKWIAGAITLTSVGGLTAWALRKKNFGDKIVIVNDIKVTTKKNALGIPSQFTLKVTPTIKNPTSVTATITQPFIELRFAESDKDAFATSQASGVKHKIKPLDETKLDTIEIPVSVTDIATKAFSLAKQIIKTKKLSLFAKTTCYLVTAAAKLKVDKTDESTINF